MYKQEIDLTTLTLGKDVKATPFTAADGKIYDISYTAEDLTPTPDGKVDKISFKATPQTLEKKSVEAINNFATIDAITDATKSYFDDGKPNILSTTPTDYKEVTE